MKWMFCILIMFIWSNALCSNGDRARLDEWEICCGKRSCKYIDSKGRKMIHRRFDDGGDFSKGARTTTVSFRRKDGVYLIDRRGCVVSRKYDFCWLDIHDYYPFLFCFGLKQEDGSLLYGVVNENDSVVVPFRYKNIPYRVHSGMKDDAYLLGKVKDSLDVEEYYDDFLESFFKDEVMVPVYDTFDVWGNRYENGKVRESWCADFYPWKKDGNGKFYLSTSVSPTPIVCDTILPSREYVSDYYRVGIVLDDFVRQGLTDLQGNVVVPLQYFNLEADEFGFVRGYKESGAVGNNIDLYLKKDGGIVAVQDKSFDYVGRVDQKYKRTIAKLNGEFFSIDLNAQLYPIAGTYDECVDTCCSLDECFFVMLKDGLYGAVNAKGDEIVPCLYSRSQAWKLAWSFLTSDRYVN